MQVTSDAVILFGHGSRDPLWRLPIESVAARACASASSRPVRCAYLELTTPDLPTVAAELIAAGAGSISVLPMFLGKGRHAREDLPALMDQLRLAHPQVHFELRPSVGEDERVLQLLTQMALD
jgi:sirohydrochlorin cobaltochelatase